MRLKDHPLYKTWKNIRKRCEDRTDKNYHNYGGRGIVVCSRWRSSAVFIADMEPTWFPGATIERVDNDGPYSPENCRWATRWEQNRNKRVNVWLDYEGERLCLADVARRVGLHKRTLGVRLRAGLQPQVLYQRRKRGKTWRDGLLDPPDQRFRSR